MFVKQLTTVYEKFLNKSESPFWIKSLRDSVAQYLCTKGARVCNHTAEYQSLLRNISTPHKLSTVYSCGAMSNATYEQWYQVTKEVYKYYRNYSSCDRCCVTKILAGCTSNKQSLTTSVPSRPTYFVKYRYYTFYVVLVRYTQ